ncbi:glycosyltransferase family 87 protein [Halorussus pelagicus]|uniref:glycosyltransferase family 87 protein n=1 Tax=Halorussus pelagicus TaxID=2505977 RepID=UPI000FFC6A93|nr:glycosyltransferase family 87 protein [Halorussus pelagicus]
MTPPRNPTDARLVLATGILLGVVGFVTTAVQHPALVGIDLQVYYFAAETALAGGDFYAAAPPMHPTYGYVYPPLTLPFFYPFALLGSWQAAFVAFTLLNVAAALGVAVLLVRSIEDHRDRPLSWLDRGLVAGFALISLHSASTLLYGETNFLLLLALVAGFRWLAIGRESRAGVAFAVPAFVKLFPAAVGVWLLRKRAWRAIAAATATGVGLFALSAAVFGVETHRTYVEFAVLPRLSSANFAGGLPAGADLLTLRRPLSVFLPNLDPSLYGPLAFGLLAPVVGYCYLNVSGPVNRLVAVFVTMAAIVVGFPSLLLYGVFLLFPLVPLLYLLERGPARTLFVAGAFVANFTVTLANVRNALGGTVLADLVGVLRPALTLGTPTLYGIVLMLCGCVVHVRNAAGTPEASPESA